MTSLFSKVRLTRAIFLMAAGVMLATLTACSPAGPRQTLLGKDRVVFFCQHPRSKATIPDELRERAGEVTVIAPMWYDIHSDGRVALISDDIQVDDYMAFCREKNVAVMPLLRNFKPLDFLLNPEAIDRALVEIAALMRTHNFAGMSVDIEEDSSDPRSTAPMLDFLDRLYAETKRQNRILCVTFNPVYWGRGWQTDEMVSRCDWAFAMFYDYSGPWNKKNVNATAPYEWPERLRDIKRDVDRIMTPANAGKIIFGIPTYGNRVTLDADGNCTEFTVAYVNTLLEEKKRVGAERQWDSVARTPRFEHQDEGGSRHVIWYEDAESYRWRMALADRFQAAGVGIWSIGAKGGLDSDIWEVLREYRAGEL